MKTIELPKWPQMRVSGKSVTIDQAKDIIFRTDSFLTSVCQYSGGNNQEFNENYRKSAGLSVEDFELEKLIRAKLGILDLYFLENNHASTCYAGGPKGWCWPDGRIYFSANVGKWPNTIALQEEWQAIAEAFPYLDLNATFMSGEYCEEGIVPLVNIRVLNGKATICEPDLSVHGDLTFNHSKETESEFDKFSTPLFGIGLPTEWYDEYAEIVRSKVSSIVNISSSLEISNIDFINSFLRE